MEDKRDILKNEKPFSWQLLKNDKAFIFWRQKSIKTISGKDLLKFLDLIELNDDYNIQLFLAKVTGHFKH
jgi:hypothetical protein